MESLSKGLTELKSARSDQWPALQVNGVPVQQQQLGGGGKQPGQGQGYLQQTGARSRQPTLPIGGLGLRSRSTSESRKRKAEEDHLSRQAGDHHQQARQEHEEPGWNQVVNRGRRKPVQYGTSKVKVTGGEAAPYDVFVGNTHPDSTEEIIKDVLIKVSERMPEEMNLTEPLEILQVECLTKPRTDGRKNWTRNWRVQVPNRFREHMLKPEAYPAGWASRKYFPARAARPQVPALDPTQQPADKRPNLGNAPGQDGQAPMDQ